MNNDLKPCPFCGGKAVLISSGNHWPEEYFRVACRSVCCMQSKFYATSGEAADAWNRRAADE